MAANVAQSSALLFSSYSLRGRGKMSPSSSSSSSFTTINNGRCGINGGRSMSIHLLPPGMVTKRVWFRNVDDCQTSSSRLHVKQGREEDHESGGDETRLYSVAPIGYVVLAPAAEALRSAFGPFADLVKTLNLPDWLVHWGHPGNMAVVLLAMGGYGTYLGFRIRFSDDPEEKAKAKDLHPKILGGMFFFFALGATGGITSLLTSDRPILQSPHAVTGLFGLTLLTIQTILPALFEGKPELRNVHSILGSSIMGLFLLHAFLGLQLGLSY